MKKSSPIQISIIAALTAMAGSGPVSAGGYPSHPIRIVVPYPAGSGGDAVARYFAQKMAPLLGQPVTVENRGGADGEIGTMFVKSAPADGYTLLQGANSVSAINAVVNKNQGYDPVVDFVPLGGYGRNSMVIVVPNDSPIKSFADLRGRDGPGDVHLSMGTFSTMLRLSAAWLGNQQHFKFTDIPYKGQDQVVVDIVGNRLDMALLDWGGAAGLISSGKLRALVVTGETRKPGFNIRTVKELGCADCVMYNWAALFARAETPADVRKKLGDAIRTIMADPDTIENYYVPRQGEPIPADPQEVRNFQLAEIARYRRIAEIVHTDK